MAYEMTWQNQCDSGVTCWTSGTWEITCLRNGRFRITNKLNAHATETIGTCRDFQEAQDRCQWMEDDRGPIHLDDFEFSGCSHFPCWTHRYSGVRITLAGMNGRFIIYGDSEPKASSLQEAIELLNVARKERSAQPRPADFVYQLTSAETMFKFVLNIIPTAGHAESVELVHSRIDTQVRHELKLLQQCLQRYKSE